MMNILLFQLGGQEMIEILNSIIFSPLFGLLLFGWFCLVIIRKIKPKSSKKFIVREQEINNRSGIKNVEYVDVLYLQNGSIIRGMIIEQIPNVKIKIQTSDGSIFVHSIDQVLKITKEPLR